MIGGIPTKVKPTAIAAYCHVTEKISYGHGETQRDCQLPREVLPHKFAKPFFGRRAYPACDFHDEIQRYYERNEYEDKSVFEGRPALHRGYHACSIYVCHHNKPRRPKDISHF